MGGRRKLLVMEYIYDLRESISYIFPDFSNESKSRQIALAKAISVLKEIPNERMFIMTDKAVRNVGTSLITVNSLLEKYPLLVWSGNTSCKNKGFKKGVAKLYKPTEELHNVFKHYATLTERRLLVYYQEKGQAAILRAYERLPSRIIKTNYDYKTVCHINVDNLERYVMAMKFYPAIDYHTVLASRLLASAKAKDGVLDQYYLRGETGRLFAGGMDSLQNIPKNLRKIIFKGAWEVDFVNCHFKIAATFCGNKAINEYAVNPEYYRSTLAEELSVGRGDIKTGLLMLLYGASFTTRKDHSLYKLFGEKVQDFIDHPFVRSVYEGVKEMKAECVWIDESDNDNNKTDSQRLAAFLQNHEARILERCVSEYEPELLLFDGFVTYRDVNVERLEEIILEDTGFEIKVKKEVIE